MTATLTNEVQTFWINYTEVNERIEKNAPLARGSVPRWVILGRIYNAAWATKFLSCNWHHRQGSDCEHFDGYLDNRLWKGRGNFIIINYLFTRLTVCRKLVLDVVGSILYWAEMKFTWLAQFCVHWDSLLMPVIHAYSKWILLDLQL